MRHDGSAAGDCLGSGKKPVERLRDDIGVAADLVEPGYRPVSMAATSAMITMTRPNPRDLDAAAVCHAFAPLILGITCLEARRRSTLFLFGA